MTMPAGSEEQQRVIDRASTDPDFRSRLLESPNAAIGEELGMALPGGVTVRVIEEQPGEVVLVLPSPGADSGNRLADSDLEEVAGGAILVTLHKDHCIA